MKKEERLKVLFTEENIENDIPKLPEQLAGLSLNGLYFVIYIIGNKLKMLLK